MRKPGLFAVAATVALIGVGAWVASSAPTRVEPPTDVRVGPLQMMKDAKELPTERPVDLSLVFE